MQKILKYAIIALAIASLLTQQMILNSGSWIPTDLSQHISRLEDQPTGDNSIRRNRGIEQQFRRLLKKPTQIYVLGERNSGTNYLASGRCLSPTLYAMQSGNKFILFFDLMCTLPLRLYHQFLKKLSTPQMNLILLDNTNISLVTFQCSSTNICSATSY